MRNAMPGWDRQTRFAEGRPHGWIQWKGTDVCMDVHCTCGLTSHVDAKYLYYVRCPDCNRVYMCNGHIELVELTADEARDADPVTTAEGA